MKLKATNFISNLKPLVQVARSSQSRRWGSDHDDLLGTGLLLLWRFPALGALATEEVIRRRLSGFDDEDALGGQRGEDRHGVHVYRDPGQTEEEGHEEFVRHQKFS